MKYIVTVIFSLLLFSCSSEKSKEHSELEGENLLKPVEIFITEPIDPARMIILNNHLFVSCFKCDTQIYTFSIPKLELIDNFGTKGQGPDEFNFAIFGAGSQKYLYLWGYSNLKQINQYEVSENGKVVFRNRININKSVLMNNFHLVKDSFIFYNEVPDALGIKRVYLYNSDKTEHISFERGQKNTCFDTNFGCLAASSNGLAYLYQYQDRIDFFDLNFNLKKTVGNIKDKTSIDSTPQGFEENVIYYTPTCYSGQKSLYVLYKGFSWKDPKNSTSNIREYDWEGSKIAEYHLDAPINIFAVDEASKKLIGCHPTRPDVFLCFDLK